MCIPIGILEKISIRFLHLETHRISVKTSFFYVKKMTCLDWFAHSLQPIMSMMIEHLTFWLGSFMRGLFEKFNITVLV